MSPQATNCALNRPNYNANAIALTHTNRALPTQRLRRQGANKGRAGVESKGWDEISE
jgi:hypothetical protein